MIRVVEYSEFKRQLGKAGLTGRAFAQLLDLHPNTISNLKAEGRVPDQLAVIAILIAELVERGIDFRALLDRVGVKSRRKRGAAAKKER